MSRLSRKLLSRPVALAVSAALVVALLLVAFLAPLPFTVMQPGITADTLGSYQGKQVITISGHAVRPTSGQLRMVTIAATAPQDSLSIWDALSAWPDPDRAVVPRDAVYPSGQSLSEINRTDQQQMTQSQNDATAAALGYLHLNADQVKVQLRLADVGGPSAGLLFALGIIDKLAGNGGGGDLTGGRTVAGTGEITSDGQVKQVGGVALKTKAAARDGATVFLLPSVECSEGRADTPAGLRLVPVDSLAQAVSALEAIDAGRGAVPSC
ncbi:S16 family serine protease [Phaeacidiphilus oryzae]|uniref:S16 family serine protease n=1 Tax=Phaeacidiphilus oryzae TaxID=348818 RepID=UPI000A7F0992|nr:S16 family serine protease [Phaeacidiphilus oryzae]